MGQRAGSGILDESAVVRCNRNGMSYLPRHASPRLGLHWPDVVLLACTIISTATAVAGLIVTLR